MRIALLSAAKSVHTVRWAEAFAARGHKVALYSTSDHRAPDGFYPPEVKVHYLKCGGGLGYWFGGAELRKMLAKFRPDVLNAHYASGYGTLARKCGFHPLFLSVWGSDVYEFPESGALNRRILQKNLQNASAIGSTSFAMAEQVKRVYGGGKIYVTPFGVDTDKFKRLREPPQNLLTVGIVKTLEPKYGVEYLIRAFALLKARLQKEGKTPKGGVRLEIYGTGSQERELKKLALELHIEGDVRFFGAVPHAQVPQILCGLNIFCAPSLSESFGVAAVEAMACEVPVVVSDADGLKEVVKDGKTGFVTARRDYVTMANKLFILACDASLRERMGAEGRRHVLQNYNWDENVSVMENALTETALEGKTHGFA